MWIVLSLLAALFSGASVVIQKRGMTGKTMQISAMSTSAGFCVMLLAVLVSGSINQLPAVSLYSWLLVAASGFIQAFSWITYFAALHDAKVNVMMALDKVNIVLAMILSYFILEETITGWMVLGCFLILAGSVVMADIRNCRENADPKNRIWIVWAVLSPSLQAVANVLTKLDTSEMNPDLTTALRTFVVITVLWIVSLIKEGKPDLRCMLYGEAGINLILGGAMVGISYIFMYRAIHDGINAVVTPIVKSNFLISTIAARILLKEKLGLRGILGFTAVFGGVLMFLLN